MLRLWRVTINYPKLKKKKKKVFLFLKKLYLNFGMWDLSLTWTSRTKTSKLTVPHTTLTTTHGPTNTCSPLPHVSLLNAGVVPRSWHVARSCPLLFLTEEKCGSSRNISGNNKCLIKTTYVGTILTRYHVRWPPLH